MLHALAKSALTQTMQGISNSNVQSRLDLPGLGQLIQTSTALQLADRPFAHFTESLHFSAELDTLHSIPPHTDRLMKRRCWTRHLLTFSRTQQLESDLPDAFRTTQSTLDPVDKALETSVPNKMNVLCMTH